MLGLVRKASYTVTMALAMLFILPATVSAAPLPTTLAGENLIMGADSLQIVSGTCNLGQPTYTFTFRNTASDDPATGPRPGTFLENGSFTIASPTGPLTRFTASFTIRAVGQPDVVGTKGFVSSISAGCAPVRPGSRDFIVHFEIVASYSVTTPFVETGTARTTIVFAGTSCCGSFTEGPFVPTPPLPVVQPGCDTDGKGNGNDQCQQ